MFKLQQSRGKGNKKVGFLLSLTLFLVAFSTTSLADSIPWEVVDQGGVIANSINYELFDASGQGAIGQANSPNYTLLAGYILPLTTLTITTTSLPDGQVGSSYSGTLIAAGGTLPYTWAIISGSLPDGLSLNSLTGLISGTPITPDTFTFAVQVTDSNSPTPQTASKDFSITIEDTSSTIVKVDPAVSYVYSDGETVTVAVAVEEVTNLHGVNFNLLFDDNELDLVSVEEGNFLPSGGETTFLSDTGPGVANVSTALLGAGVRVSGSGPIANFTFKVPNTALLPVDLTLEEVVLVDQKLNPITANIQMGRIEKRGMPFDCNSDCYIDYDDLVCLAMSWHCRVGEDCFNPAMDCPVDDYVNYRDMFNFSMLWHTGCDDSWDTLISCEPVSPAPMRWLSQGAEVQRSGGAKVQQIYSTVSLSNDRRLEVNIMANQITDLHGLNIDLSFNSQKLEVIEVEPGDLISGMPFFKVDTRQAGLINLAGTFLGRDPGVDGSGVVAKVIFKVNNPDASTELRLDQVIAADHNNVHYNLTPGELGSVITLRDLIPSRNSLHQNYPNPMNPETWLPFSLSTRDNVVINIYSLSGQLIRRLALGEKEAGHYTAKGGIKSAAYWDGKDEAGEEVASGIYLYQLQAGSFVSTRKMIVLK